MKLRSVRGYDLSATIGFNHWCPGCDEAHHIRTQKQTPAEQVPVWSFNGSLENPTFSPSVRIRTDIAGVPRVCHYFIDSNLIRFCSDSTHALAGKTVPLPDFPEDW